MRRWLGGLLAVLMLGSTALGEADERLDRLFGRYSTLGACVVVFQNGEITYTHCYGTVKPRGDAITADTGFQVGSIGKMAAGVALMQLVQNGRIGLDDPLETSLGFAVENPAYPGQEITLRQLMTHTAGIRDSGAYQAALYGDITPLSELLSGAQASRSFYAGIAPGTEREYSNFGGGIAGVVVEAVTGQTLDQYMTEHVFGPLGVTAAYQVGLLPLDMPLADMYRMPAKRLAKALRDGSVPSLTPDVQHDYGIASGKLIITAPGLARLLIALCDGGVYGDARILKPSTVAEMLTPQNDRGSVHCQSEHGLLVNIHPDIYVDGRTLYGHGGKANGMLCAAYFDPTDRTGVVMLTNGCTSSISYRGVGRLGREVILACYEEVIGATHVAEDPWLVGE